MGILRAARGFSLAVATVAGLQQTGGVNGAVAAALVREPVCVGGGGAGVWRAIKGALEEAGTGRMGQARAFSLSYACSES